MRILEKAHGNFAEQDQIQSALSKFKTVREFEHESTPHSYGYSFRKEAVVESVH
jgi:hypothetical protein